MKNINNTLRRSNITPLERATLLVHNDVHKEKTGNQILSDSDIYSLTKSWSPNTTEAKEYNRYISIINLESSMRLDAQMFLYQSELALLRNQRVLDNSLSFSRKLKHISDKLFSKDISQKESIGFLTRNTYLRYEYLLHTYTFHNLPKEIQKDLVLLDGEIKNCEKYMCDQVFLYERFKNGMVLSFEDKSLIINRIYSRMYYEGAKKIEKSTAEKDGFILHSFFAELPVRDLFEKIVVDECDMVSKEKIDTEELLLLIEKCAKNKNITIERLLKDTLSQWIDNGLFIDEYSPIFMSERFDTWNGNTKTNHKELFTAWYDELQKTKQYFDKLFESKKLTKKTIQKDLLGMTKDIEIITGISLHNCTEETDFVLEYKKQIESLLPISNMFLFIERNVKPITNYQTLCEFKKLTEKISILFDIDMSERYVEFTNLYKEEIAFLNISLERLLDVAMEHLYTEGLLEYLIDINDKSFMFDLDSKNECEVAKIANLYSDEFKKNALINFS